jgi:hypothetical protein
MDERVKFIVAATQIEERSSICLSTAANALPA